MWQSTTSQWLTVDVICKPKTLETVMEQEKVSVKQDTCPMRVPGLLGRIPLFLPMKQRKEVNGVMVSPWGIVKFPNGQPLTVADEDCFLMILNKAEQVDEHYSVRAVKMTPSVEALCRTTVVINTEYRIKSGKQWKAEKQEFRGSLLTIIGEDGEKVKVKVLNRWLRSESYPRTIDAVVRNQLRFMGKALYRFMMCHGQEMKVTLNNLRDSVAPYRKENFRRDVVTHMNILMSMGVVTSYGIEGNKVVRWTRKKLS